QDAVELALQRVLAVDAVADHHVGAVELREQERDLVQVELQVAVGEEHELVARGGLGAARTHARVRRRAKSRAARPPRSSGASTSRSFCQPGLWKANTTSC